MNMQIDNSIVRIIDNHGRIVGAGFLISSQYILTCAHVVTTALGVPSDIASAPENFLSMDFPLVKPGLIIRARTFIWKPNQQNVTHSNDIAVLQLIESPPKDAAPTHMIVASDLWDHSFKAFGFPSIQTNGVWASGRLRGRQASGFIQIEDIKEAGYRIQPGFSGTPVWDEYLGGVVGMVVAAERQTDVRAAFMIPADTLHLVVSAIADVPAVHTLPPPLILHTSFGYRREDWNGALDVESFYGRTAEMTELDQWITNDKCRIVTIVGIGGIGKTTLSIKVAQQVKLHFSHVLWRTLKNPLSVDDYLAECVRFLSDQQLVDLPDDIDSKVKILIEYLREKRCLLILDNVESILREGDRAGRYLEGYEAYGELIQRVGESAHQSCLVITTREKPRELAVLEGKRSPVRVLELRGLSTSDSQSILEDKGIAGSPEGWSKLITRYSGNPLVLKLLAEPIRELFGGDIDIFLRDGSGLFDDTYSLLRKQFSRLSDLEREIMYWLAIDRDIVPLEELLKDIIRLSDLSRAVIYWLVIEQEGVTLDKLLQNLVKPVSKRELLEELASLRRRSMIETTQGRFTLQPVIMEYITEQFIEVVSEEIVSEKINLLASHALIKAQAKDFVRESQTRLILQPLITKLMTNFRVKRNLEHRLLSIINRLRERAPLAPGYVGGNILNLLRHMDSDLRNADFSQTIISQAYLQGVSLHGVNFTGADLESSLFNETFGSIFAVTFSPDGRYLAAGSANGEVRLWQIVDSLDGLTLGEIDLLWTTLNTLDDWIWSVAFHPTGKTLASANDNFTIKFWDVSSGDCLTTLRGHTDRVWSLSFSPDGTLLASASDDQTVRLWDGVTGELLTVLTEHQHRVVCVRFSPDGEILASASNDQTIRFWDVATTTEIMVIDDEGCKTVAIDFNPNGRLLASGGEDKLIKIWNVSTGECLAELHGHTDRISTLAFSPDGRTLASGSDDQTIRVWDLESYACLQVMQGHTGLIWSIAFNPDNNLLASGSEDQTLKLWSPMSGYCMRTLQGYTNQIWSAAFSPDGAIVAAGYEDHTVKLWDIQNGRILRTLSGHTSRVRALAFSKDGMTLVSGSEDRTIRLWNMRMGRSTRILQEHRNPVWCVALSGDGNIVASGSDDCTLRLWDTRTGKCVRVVHDLPIVWSVAFSPTGTLLASAHEDHQIRLWDVASGECITNFEGHTNVVRSLAFSPDGKYLLSGSADFTARIWDLQTGECIMTFTGHDSFIKTIDYSANGLVIASGSDDLTVKLWDVQTGHCLHTLRGHSNLVKVVRFSPDGNTLVSGGEDGLLILWDIATGNMQRTLLSDRPYERMNITGVTGLTAAQKETLRALGAIDEAVTE